MPSPHQVIAALIAEVWPDRIGMASDIGGGILHRLNEAGYTISIMGTPAQEPVTDVPPLHDAPKTFRIDRWVADGSALEEFVAGVSDYQVATTAYNAAAARWPKSAVTLRQGTRVLSETRLVGPRGG